jgi:hypothetical protein
MADPTIFQYFDKATLESMLQASVTQASGSKGLLIVEYSVGGRTAKKMPYLGTMEEFLGAVNWALSRLDPVTYPPLVDRTRSSFAPKGPWESLGGVVQ